MSHSTDRDGGGSTGVWIAVVAAGLFYFLSLGPVACLVRKGVIPSTQTNIKILETVYAPVFAVFDHVKGVEKFYDSWVAVCERMMSGIKR